MTYVFQIFELPFRIYAYLAASATSLFTVLTAVRLGRNLATMSPADRKNGLRLLLLGPTGVALAMLSHRENHDSYVHLPNVRYFLEYPATSLDLDIHMSIFGIETLSVPYL